MNTMTRILTPLLFASLVCGTAFADNDVQISMKAMGKSLVAAEKADNAASLQKELTALHDAIIIGQKQVPEHLKNQAADSADRKLYVEGMSKLLAETDRALALAKENKLDESKAVLANIKALRGEYHKKLKP